VVKSATVKVRGSISYGIIYIVYLLYVQYFIFQGVFLSHAQRGNKTLSEPIMHDNNPRHFIFLISNHRISVIIDFYDNTGIVSILVLKTIISCTTTACCNKKLKETTALLKLLRKYHKQNGPLCNWFRSW
jgi:hypothetical protein